jgi:hypothetical protein
MKNKFILLLAAFGLAGASVQAGLLISQYVETNSGTTPKGIELWNSGLTTIDFSVTNLDVLKGTNGGAPSSDFTLNVGTLLSGEVLVIGTADIGTYLDATFGSGIVQYYLEGFTFNGDDSLVIQLDGATVDVFGTPLTDPGSAWSGSGVSTANQNIQLIESPSPITTGTLTGFTDPSTRFTTVSTDPSGAGGLVGFGVVPIPEPSSLILMGLVGLAAVVTLRKRKK